MALALQCHSLTLVAGVESIGQFSHWSEPENVERKAGPWNLQCHHWVTILLVRPDYHLALAINAA